MAFTIFLLQRSSVGENCDKYVGTQVSGSSINGGMTALLSAASMIQINPR